MSRLLAVNGSYRENGAIDQAVEVAVQEAAEAGAAVEVILLRDFAIEFCTNCRHCTQMPGDVPGKCVQQDRMQELVEKIEQADAYIFAAPTNFYSVTAIFKRCITMPLCLPAILPWRRISPRKPSSGLIRTFIDWALPGISMLGSFGWRGIILLTRSEKSVTYIRWRKMSK